MNIKAILSVFACVLVLLSVPALAADDQAARLKAAEAYEKATPVEEIVSGMLNDIARNPQVGLSPQQVEAIRSSINMEELRKVTVESMAKHFTVQELEALSSFYGSSEGQSIMKKMPAYMSDVMPYIQQAAMQAVGTMMQGQQ